MRTATLVTAVIGCCSVTAASAADEFDGLSAPGGGVCAVEPKPHTWLEFVHGFDLGHDHLADVRDCAKACCEHSGCTAFSHHAEDRRCYLRSTPGLQRVFTADAAWSSGVVRRLDAIEAAEAAEAEAAEAADAAVLPADSVVSDTDASGAAEAADAAAEAAADEAEAAAAAAEASAGEAAAEAAAAETAAAEAAAESTMSAPGALQDGAEGGAAAAAHALEEAALSRLGAEKPCLTVSTGWWEYVWCFRADIRQQHYEVKGDTRVLGDDWSLGSFSASLTEATTQQQQQQQQQRYYSHKHSGGQPCDPTPPASDDKAPAAEGVASAPPPPSDLVLVPRAAEVRFYCCDADPAEYAKGTHLRQVGEPRTCSYVLHVCSLRLCGNGDGEPTGGVAQAVVPADAVPALSARYASRHPPCCGRHFSKVDVLGEQQLASMCAAACAAQHATAQQLAEDERRSAAAHQHHGDNEQQQQQQQQQVQPPSAAATAAATTAAAAEAPKPQFDVRETHDNSLRISTNPVAEARAAEGQKSVEPLFWAALKNAEVTVAAARKGGSEADVAAVGAGAVAAGSAVMITLRQLLGAVDEHPTARTRGATRRAAAAVASRLPGGSSALAEMAVASLETADAAGGSALGADAKRAAELRALQRAALLAPRKTLKAAASPRGERRQGEARELAARCVARLAAKLAESAAALNAAAGGLSSGTGRGLYAYSRETMLHDARAVWATERALEAAREAGTLYGGLLRQLKSGDGKSGNGDWAAEDAAAAAAAAAAGQQEAAQRVTKLGAVRVNALITAAQRQHVAYLRSEVGAAEGVKPPRELTLPFREEEEREAVARQLASQHASQQQEEEADAGQQQQQQQQQQRAAAAAKGVDRWALALAARLWTMVTRERPHHTTARVYATSLSAQGRSVDLHSAAAQAHELAATAAGVAAGGAAAGGGGAAPAALSASRYLEYVEDEFDSYAGEYDGSRVSVRYAIPDLLKAALKAALGGRSAPAAAHACALDLGVGTGLVGQALADLWAELRSGPSTQRGAAAAAAQLSIVGVDISKKMIAKAAARQGVYGRIDRHEIVEWLRAKGFEEGSALAGAGWATGAGGAGTACAVGVPPRLIASGDVFVYFGDLTPVVSAMAASLPAGGVVAFTTEAMTAEEEEESRRANSDGLATYVLRPSARHAHAAGYLARVGAAAGLEMVWHEVKTLR
jgi:predicted TPR repeat methyltransferase